MENNDRIIAMQQALMTQGILATSRERLSDRNIEVLTLEMGMSFLNEAIESSLVGAMRPLQGTYNSAMAEMNLYVAGIDPYVGSKPIQDDDQIIF